jgi:signal-transduction protein with cAMP-binding, CBS, and nucleotidyltransferase domain
MPSAFNFSASPFDCLTPEQRRLVQNSVDIAYFPQGETILDLGSQPSHLFVIIKGYVQQFDGNEVITTYGPDDCFDGRGLVASKVSSRFVAAEEVVAYQLAKQAVSDLIADNATFGALLFSDLSNKLNALSERQSQHELQSLAMARVDAAFIHPAAGQITHSIGMLHRSGTKVGQIARLVQELNAKLFERAWQLVAPADLVENSCLFVMGSEGRGEQILKTDQDNGLILRDGYDCPHDLAAICQRFSEALTQFGYPECPGRIMVSNPDWRHPASEFGRRAKGWLLQPSAESLMALAIFIDAHAVCGDAALLEQVRGELDKLATDNDGLLARFAASVEAFNEGQGWWNRILTLGDSGKEQLDLKKAGTFPLVHGIRALALQQRLTQTGTVERIEALVAADKLSAQMGTDLIECLHFFMNLKLKTGLQALAQGQQPGGIQVDKLSSLDRDLLKDALGVVKRFKALLRQHFRLDVL